MCCVNTVVRVHSKYLDYNAQSLLTYICIVLIRTLAVGTLQNALKIQLKGDILMDTIHSKCRKYAFKAF